MTFRIFISIKKWKVVLHVINDSKVIKVYKKRGFGTIEDDVEEIVSLLAGVMALYGDNACGCKFIFRDLEYILDELDRFLMDYLEKGTTKKINYIWGKFDDILAQCGYYMMLFLVGGWIGLSPIFLLFIILIILILLYKDMGFRTKNRSSI